MQQLDRELLGNTEMRLYKEKDFVKRTKKQAFPPLTFSVRNVSNFVRNVRNVINYVRNVINYVSYEKCEKIAFCEE